MGALVKPIEVAEESSSTVLSERPQLTLVTAEIALSVDTAMTESLPGRRSPRAPSLESVRQAIL